MILTKEETTWLKKLTKLLDECPDRFEAYTVGDASLMFYDKNVLTTYQDGLHWKQNEGLIADVENSGAKLKMITCRFNIGCGG